MLIKVNVIRVTFTSRFFSHIFFNYIFCYLNGGNIKREITASNAAKYCDKKRKCNYSTFFSKLVLYRVIFNFRF